MRSFLFKSTKRYMRTSGCVGGASAVLVTALLLAGCTIGSEAPKPTEQRSTGAVTLDDRSTDLADSEVFKAEPDTAESRGPDLKDAAEDPQAASIQSVLNEMMPRLPAGASVTIFDGVRSYSIGDNQVGPAWSTSKVPLTQVALARGVASQADVRAAITASDNQAAERVWESLGGGEAAAAAVSNHIGVPVPAFPPRAGFSAFGQTQWGLSDQAAYAFNLPCSGGEVYRLMGEISPDQAWGLGTIPGAHFKGGWGPSPEGNYLVRQFGTVPTATGPVGIAIAVWPVGGTFDQGTSQLSSIAADVRYAIEEGEVAAHGYCGDGY